MEKEENKKYLIGPEYYDTYIFILKLILIIATFGVAIGKGIDLFVNPPESFIQGFGGFISAIVSALFSAFTFVTILFALNDRYGFLDEPIQKVKAGFHIKAHPKKKQHELIKPVEVVFSIIFSLLFTIVFGFFSQIIAVYLFDNGKLTSVIPLFNADTIRQFIVIIIILLGLAVIKECIKLYVGRWNIPLGFTAAVISIVSMIFCVVIFSNSSVWNNSFINQLKVSGINFDNVDIENLWLKFTQGFVYLLMLGYLIDAAVSVIKGFRYGSKTLTDQE